MTYQLLDSTLEQMAEMKRNRGGAVATGTIALFYLCIVSSCTMSNEADRLHAHSGSLKRVDSNNLSFNRISLNRISLNRISLNRISLNSLGGLETTPEGRELLEYTIRCTLEDGDVFTVKHDGVIYEFPGLLGLAPDWRWRPLDKREQGLLSGCLVAHVNAYGESVPISVRSFGAVAADPYEIENFPIYEGSFFGDVLGETLKAYACIGDLPEIAGTHSSDRSLRACTDPSEDCAVESVGRCRDVCETYHPTYGWMGCHVGEEFYPETISVYLFDDTNDHLNRICGAGNDCNYECSNGGDAVLDCDEAGSCSSVCQDGSTCTLRGSYADGFKAIVSDGSLAEIACHEARLSEITCSDSQCDIGCTGADSIRVVARVADATISCAEANECAVDCTDASSCQIDCTDANECRQRVSCTDGAECLLQCQNAADCGFSICEGQLTVCDGGLIACNRPCP